MFFSLFGFQQKTDLRDGSFQDAVLGTDFYRSHKSMSVGKGLQHLAQQPGSTRSIRVCYHDDVSGSKVPLVLWPPLSLLQQWYVLPSPSVPEEIGEELNLPPSTFGVGVAFIEKPRW